MKYGIIGFTLFLMSCAALGSKTKVYSHTRINSIKSVGLITKRVDQPRSPSHKMIKESFTRALLDELEKKDVFEIVVVLDTLENEQLSIESYETDVVVDALLVAEWKLSNPRSMVTDSNVQLTLLDQKTKEVLLVSSHGTKFGNSYGMTPSLPQTLLDATEGAINAMQKSINAEKVSR